ncbi:MAG: winged helix-turn-helix transcriptional regulator [Desulfobacterium sp.]|nr:winged helix-turn-helix transcriptional regulator [Desulfobacterium sp.]
MKNEIDKKIMIVRKLLQIGAYLQKTGARVTKEYGLTQQQFVVLNEIVEKKTVNQKQLVGELLFEKSNVSKIVKKLNHSELIDISISKGDARLTILSATKKGADLRRKCLDSLNELSLEWLDSLSEYEIEKSLNSLSVIRQLIFKS